MHVRDAMSSLVLTVGPGHTLREVSRQMAERSIGSAAVIDPDSPGPAIITERDILVSIAAGQDPDTELVCDHLTEGLISAAPDWSLERAAQAMIDGGFRHLLIIDGAEIVGVLSMRDIVRCWTSQSVTTGA
jgi:CBS domain-containing protein